MKILLTLHLRLSSLFLIALSFRSVTAEGKFQISAIIGAVVGTFCFTTLFGSVIAFLFFTCWKRRFKRRLKREANLGNSQFKPPRRLEECGWGKESGIIPTLKTGGYEGQITTTNASRRSKKSKDFLDKLHRHSGKLKRCVTAETETHVSSDSSSLRSLQSDMIVVRLKSSDPVGLGFNVSGGGQDGIYIKEILPNGPASNSGQIHEGDRIVGITVSMQHMQLEDAMTILSYASPYPLSLRLCQQDSFLSSPEESIGEAEQTEDLPPWSRLKRQYRSISLDRLEVLSPKSRNTDTLRTPTRTQSELRKQTDRRSITQLSNSLSRWAAQDDILLDDIMDLGQIKVANFNVKRKQSLSSTSGSSQSSGGSSRAKPIQSSGNELRGVQYTATASIHVAKAQDMEKVQESTDKLNMQHHKQLGSDSFDNNQAHKPLHRLVPENKQYLEHGRESLSKKTQKLAEEFKMKFNKASYENTFNCESPASDSARIEIVDNNHKDNIKVAVKENTDCCNEYENVYICGASEEGTSKETNDTTFDGKTNKSLFQKINESAQNIESGDSKKAIPDYATDELLLKPVKFKILANSSTKTNSVSSSKERNSSSQLLNSSLVKELQLRKNSLGRTITAESGRPILSDHVSRMSNGTGGHEAKNILKPKNGSSGDRPNFLIVSESTLATLNGANPIITGDQDLATSTLESDRNNNSCKNTDFGMNTNSDRNKIFDENNDSGKNINSDNSKNPERISEVMPVLLEQQQTESMSVERSGSSNSLPSDVESNNCKNVNTNTGKLPAFQENDVIRHSNSSKISTNSSSAAENESNEVTNIDDKESLSIFVENKSFRVTRSQAGDVKDLKENVSHSSKSNSFSKIEHSRVDEPIWTDLSRFTLEPIEYKNN